MADVPEQRQATDRPEARDDLDAAIALVRRLPDDQADAVLLRVVADLDVSEVAAILGRSEGNVRVLTHRGLKKLAELLGVRFDAGDENAEELVTEPGAPAISGER